MKREPRYVLEANVARRINYRLARKGWLLRKTRGQYQRWQLGRYHVVDRGTGRVLADHVDIEHMAREHNALRPHEFLLEEIEL